MNVVNALTQIRSSQESIKTLGWTDQEEWACGTAKWLGGLCWICILFQSLHCLLYFLAQTLLFLCAKREWNDLACAHIVAVQLYILPRMFLSIDQRIK